MSFDPKTYLSNSTASGFDPVAYLSNKPQPYKGTVLENAAEKISAGMGKLAPVAEVATDLGDTLSPDSGAIRFGNDVMNSGIDASEGAAAGALGKAGVNPYLAAGGIKAAEIAAAMLLGPKASGTAVEGRFLKPVVSAERKAAVEAADALGVPTSRAERTGGKFSTAFENLLDKTVFGSGKGDARKAAQAKALEAEKLRLQEQMGSPKDAYAAGAEAKGEIPKRDAAMNDKRQAMFDAIPDNVHIPPTESKAVADTIIKEQGDYLPTTRNSDVIAIAKDIQSAETSAGMGVTGGPEVRGETTITPERKLPATTKTVQSSMVDASGKPLNYKEAVPGKTIPESREYGAVHSVGPEEQFAPKSNYQQLKRLRETLGGKIGEAQKAGRYSEARDFTRLKAALDKDIENFVQGQTQPADKMVADEFAKTYEQANAFSGAHKGLFKGDLAAKVADMPPERVISNIFTPNNETAIKEFRALAGEEGFAAIKKQFAQQLLESPNLNKELDKLKGSASAIFTPQELGQLRRLGLAQEVPKTVGKLQGTHGSARSNVALAQWGTLTGGLGGAAGTFMAGHPVAAGVEAAGAVGQMALPAALSKVYEGTRRGIRVRVPANTAARAGLVGALEMRRRDKK